MKNKNEEKWCQAYLADEKLWLFLEHCDEDLAEKCRQGGCLLCGGRLHRADFERKPRGLLAGVGGDVYRYSFCCDQEGCRKRHTPASLRFLGRRVYLGVVVVLVSAMCHVLEFESLRDLRERLGIDRRTLKRWRVWWQESFVQCSFWKAARARFAPPVCQSTLPLSLCEGFGFEIERRDRLLDLLKFLSPLTASEFLVRQDL